MNRRPLTTAAALCAVVALAAGCSDANGKEPEPSPTTQVSLPPMTAEPTGDGTTGEGESSAPVDQRTADEQAAMDVYREYTARYNAAAHTGFEDHVLTDQAGELLGGDARLNYYEGTVPGLRGTGIHTEGDRVITAMEVVDYTPGDGTGAGMSITLEVCTDESGVTLHEEDGTKVELQGDYTLRYRSEVDLKRVENLLIYGGRGEGKPC